MSVEFLPIALVVVPLSGTGVLYTIAVGRGHGWRPRVAAALALPGARLALAER